MSEPMLPGIKKFRETYNSIGRLLIAYGEIEFCVLSCLCRVLPSVSIAVQTMFRVRSEKSRLDVADAILRPKFRELKLLGAYSDAMEAAHRCRALRNQYAHCHWYNSGEYLSFSNLEDSAKEKGDKLGMKMRPVDEALLQEQESYFFYAEGLFMHLLGHLENHVGESEERPLQKPQKRAPVKLYSSQRTQARRAAKKEN